MTGLSKAKEGSQLPLWRTEHCNWYSLWKTWQVTSFFVFVFFTSKSPQNHSFLDFALLTHVNHCDTFHCKQSLTYLSSFSRVSVSVRQRQVSFLTASSQSPQMPVVIKMLSLGNSGRTATWSRYSVRNKLHPLMPISLLHWQDAKVQPLTKCLFYFQLKYTWANSAEQKCKTKCTSNLAIPPPPHFTNQ